MEVAVETFEGGAKTGSGTVFVDVPEDRVTVLEAQVAAAAELAAKADATAQEIATAMRDAASDRRP